MYSHKFALNMGVLWEQFLFTFDSSFVVYTTVNHRLSSLEKDIKAP